MNMLSKNTQEAIYKLLKGEPCDFIIAIHPHDSDKVQVQGAGNYAVMETMADKISKSTKSQANLGGDK